LGVRHRHTKGVKTYATFCWVFASLGISFLAKLENFFFRFACLTNSDFKERPFTLSLFKNNDFFFSFEKKSFYFIDSLKKIIPMFTLMTSLGG
jgi:hypothetical protein